MSIQINKKECRGCKSCMEACPGNLIVMDSEGKAEIAYPRDCWGCTSCLKECKFDAIQFYLGADIGGMGSLLHIREDNGLLIWSVEKWDGGLEEIVVDKNRSNQY